VPSDLIEELKTYGIGKIGQLEALVTGEFVENYKATMRENTNIGLMRDVMMYHDIDKYFSGPIHWGATSPETVDLLSSKYDREKVERLFEEHGKRILSTHRPGKRRK
jgi:putative GTP pyrophosphokinase